MDYLNQDHPVFRSSPARLASAVNELLVCALRCSQSFRLEFDGRRLERVIRPEAFRKLMPKLQRPESDARTDSSPYDIYEDLLDETKSEILHRILSLAPEEGYDERPLNYIRSARLLDREGRTILRGGDRMEFILFALPEVERAALSEAYCRDAIPAAAIEQVHVDVDRLRP
jgi:hypothetical protein